MEDVRGGKPIVAVLMPVPVTAEAPNRLLKPKHSSGPSAVDHVIPGEGFIASPEMCAKLRSAHYRGPVLMEVMMAHSRFKEPADFLREAHWTAIDTWNLIHNNGASNKRVEATR